MEQCDGCQQGLPVENGLHRNQKGRYFVSCTKDRYMSNPTNNEIDKIVDIICSLRKGSMDDKQFRATVEYGFRTEVEEAEKRGRGQFPEFKKFSHLYDEGFKSGVEQERKDIEEQFCGSMHLFRETAGKNQLLLLSNISKAFRNIIRNRTNK